MQDRTPDVVIPVVAIIMLYGWIPIAIWLVVRHKTRGRELAHVERMKALEQGQALPDLEIAQANVERSRARAAGAVGAVVPVATAAVALGATLPLMLASRDHLVARLAVLAVVWAVTGMVGVVAITRSLAALRRPAPPPAPETRTPAAERSPGDQRVTIREGW